MKKLPILLLFISLMACTANVNNGFKEPAYMGFNGQISAIEVAHYSGSQGEPWRVEVFNFDNNGNLTERLCYSDLSKNVLLEKDTYKRDESGSLIEEYKGFNLNDNHYIAESTWQKMENEEVEKWKKIADDWWGTSYKEITYTDGKKLTKNYVIKTDNGEEVNVTNITHTANDKGQLISEKTVTKGNPENTRTWTYNENGHLVKIELEQVFDDGRVNNLIEDAYTIDEIDNKNNPLKVTDSQGRIKTYKYTYR